MTESRVTMMSITSNGASGSSVSSVSNALGKDVGMVYKGAKGLGVGISIISIVSSSGRCVRECETYTNTKKPILRFGLDVTMTAIGGWFPYGTIISSGYYLFDATCGDRVWNSIYTKNNE